MDEVESGSIESALTTNCP